MQNVCAIILAGGEGTRMKSDKPKTMSEVLGRPMLRWVIDSLMEGGVSDICVVTGYKKEFIEQYLKTLPFEVSTVYQSERLGTGHAVMMAEKYLKQKGGDVVILGGDAPFIDCDAIADAYSLHSKKGASVTVISAEVENPRGYGRIVRDSDSGALCRIVEQKDADAETDAINEVNSGAYWFGSNDLLSVLNKISSDNAAKEYYLPDAVKLLIADGKKAEAYKAASSDTVLGANNPEELEMLNRIAIEKLEKR